MGKFLKNMPERKVEYQNAGSREKLNYIMKVDKDGHKYLQENGYTNIYEKIQADKESSDINNIIRRVVRGDTSMLNFNATYGDYINTPTNLIDAMNITLRAEAMWNSLPVDIRKEYDNDVNKYVADFGTEHFLKIHGVEPQTTPTEIVKEEVKENA